MNFEPILQILLPLLVGASLGLIGGGGTVLAVPLLIYIFHIEPKSAIGMSLGIVSLVSLAGSFSHWKRGNVRLENAAFFTPFAMLGAFLGAKIATLPWLTSSVQMILFGGTVVVASFLMIFRKSPTTATPEPTHDTTGESPNTYPRPSLQGQLTIAWKTVFLLAIQGMVVGLLTGLVGVGGGFLIVPALVFIAHLSIREAIGTSLVVIFFNSMSGFLGYLGKVAMDWVIMAQFLGLSLAGVYGGVRFGDRVPKKNLQKIFGIFLLIMGTWILYRQMVG